MDDATRAAIEERAWEILQEAGLTRPPVSVEDLISHLKLFRDFYSLDDPSFVQRMLHKFDVRVQKVIKAVKKSKIVAAWSPDSSTIMVDRSLPKLKQTWPQFHEVTHSILPWHREFFLGDTAQTLMPEYQEALESAANYGGGELMFCGPVFRKNILDYKPEWNSVENLRKRFGTTATATLWKYVDTYPTTPMIAVISTPTWKELAAEQEQRVKHWIPSPQFRRHFRSVNRDYVVAQIDLHSQKKSGGPVGDYGIQITDDNGDLHEFRVQSFFNTHDLLTLITHSKKLGK